MKPSYNEDLGTMKIVISWVIKKQEICTANLPCYKEGLVISDLFRTRFHCTKRSDITKISVNNLSMFQRTPLRWAIAQSLVTMIMFCMSCVINLVLFVTVYKKMSPKMSWESTYGHASFHRPTCMLCVCFCARREDSVNSHILNTEFDNLWHTKRIFHTSQKQISTTKLMYSIILHVYFISNCTAEICL